MRRLLPLLACALIAGGAFAEGPAPAIWRGTFSESDGVQLDVRMHVVCCERGKWEIWSRPGGVGAMTPWYQRFFGRLLGKLPPHGALIVGRGDARPGAGDTVFLRGTIDSPFLGSRVFAGTIGGGRMHAVLRRAYDTTRIAGIFAALPDSQSTPYRDYPAIARAVRDTITELVFDPQLASRANYRDFFARFAADMRTAQDDLDAIAAFYALKPKLRQSHFNFVRSPKIASTPVDSLMLGDPAVDPSTLVTVQFPAPGLAYIHVRRWDRVAPHIDRAFVRIDSANASVLIIDIRGNPGGDATSMVPAAHLFRDTNPVGVFVGRKWYASHRTAPNASEQAAFPVIANEADALHLLDWLKMRGGVLGRMAPRSPTFIGRVFLLTGANTGSASEPLAHLLKTTGRATLIGERTAGAMLTALPHPVGDGFVVVVPEADFFAADGTRLEGNGVTPHIPSTSANALVVVGHEVRKVLPFAGAVWLANAHATLQRHDQSLHWLRAALKVAPDSVWARRIEGRIANASARR